jgi:hypothetical protein
MSHVITSLAMDDPEFMAPCVHGDPLAREMMWVQQGDRMWGDRMVKTRDRTYESQRWEPGDPR